MNHLRREASEGHLRLDSRPVGLTTRSITSAARRHAVTSRQADGHATLASLEHVGTHLWEVSLDVGTVGQGLAWRKNMPQYMSPAPVHTTSSFPPVVAVLEPGLVLVPESCVEAVLPWDLGDIGYMKGRKDCPPSVQMV